MAYRLLDDALIDEIDASPPEFQNDWLFLVETEEFPGFWKVEGIDHEFFYDFEDLLGAYRLVSPARLDAFLEEAEVRNYKVAFVQPPEQILEAYRALNEVPPVSLNSSLEHTVNGFLPWQVIGFNKLIKSGLPAGLAIWDTGAGKTALEAGAIKYKLPEIDLACVVVKAHNKIDTQRKLYALADIESTVIDGDHGKRTNRYEEVELKLESGEPVVVVTNYETFRNDSGIMDYLVTGRDCFFAQPLDSKVLTPHGWRLMGDLQPGDAIVSSNGSHQAVNRVIDQGEQDEYRLTFSDGSTARSSADHLWTFDSLAGYRTTKSLSAFANDLFRSNGSQPSRAKWALPRLEPVWGSAEPGMTKLPIDPYILGALLGDGSLTRCSLFYDFDGDVARAVTSRLAPGYRLANYRDGMWNIVKMSPSNKPNLYIDAIRSLGLFGCTARHKFIPAEYMTASRSQRLWLLAGLIDTDGTVNGTTWRFRSVSRGLVDDVIALIRSLGGYATLSRDSNGWTVCFSGLIPPLQVRKKLARVGSYKRYTQRRRSLVRVEKIGRCQMRCIVVSAKDQLYVTDDYVLTHNCWDEMPAKLGNRDSKLYKAVKNCLYKSFPGTPRTKSAQHLVLTATPIENDPGGLYNYLNLVRPRYLGTIAYFETQHVARRSPYGANPELGIPGKPTHWTGLDKIEAQVEHMTHRVNKADPDVAAMFPEMIVDDMIIDWNPKHRAIYDRFTEACKKLIKDEDSGINALSMIQVLQMLCDAPSMVLQSAQNRSAFLSALEQGLDLGGDPMGSEAALKLLSMVPLGKLTDTGHTKLDAWKNILTVKHPDSKVVTHSTWASYIFPVWEKHLTDWGISYVIFSGTDKQKQNALDAFREDPDIRVFLSGDAGSDSIDMPQADVGVSFNGAWKDTTHIQRRGRINRVDSTFDTNYYYNLMMADSVEDRKKEIRDRKKAYHDAIFEGRAVESALSARMDQSDLFYILRGDEDE